MNRLPWFKFFPADWIKGTAGLSTRSRGIWITLLAHMWENEPQGQIEGDWERIARLIGEDWLHAEGEILKLEAAGVLDIVHNVSASCPQNVRIMSRRMSAECHARESERRRAEIRRESDRLRQIEKRRKDVRRLSGVCPEKKSEVRSQKSEKGFIAAPPQTPTPLTPIQRIVLVYKMVSGYPKEDPAWDKLNFARCSKSAKALFEFMGNWQNAADCVQDVYEKLTAKGLTVTLETVVKHAAEWKKDHQEKQGGRNGIPSLPSHGSGSFKPVSIEPAP